MLENIFTVGNYVLILFILMGVGFFCNKSKMLKGSTLKDLTNFVLYIVTPCVIINSYQRAFDKDMLYGLVITVAMAALSFALNILLAHVLIKDKKDKRKEKTLRFGVVFSNCAYMSLPLQQAVLGEVGVFYGATYIAVFQIVLWTYGVILMSGNMKSISVKKIFINPGVISTAIGIVLYVSGFSIPFTLLEPVKFLAALNTPLPMVIVGYYLAESSLRLKGASSCAVLILRLIASPLIMIALLYAFGISGDIAIACTIAASAPIAAAATMFCEKFDGDTALSASLVSITTIVSIITMPLVVAIAAVL